MLTFALGSRYLVYHFGRNFEWIIYRLGMQMRFDGIYGDGERENASVKKWGFNFPQFPNTEAPFSRQGLLRAGGEISCLFPAINLNCSPHFFGALPRNNLNFGARRRRRNKPQTPLDAAIFQSIVLSDRMAESQ